MFIQVVFPLVLTITPMVRPTVLPMLKSVMLVIWVTLKPTVLVKLP